MCHPNLKSLQAWPECQCNYVGLDTRVETHQPILSCGSWYDHQKCPSINNWTALFFMSVFPLSLKNCSKKKIKENGFGFKELCLKWIAISYSFFHGVSVGKCLFGFFFSMCYWKEKKDHQCFKTFCNSQIRTHQAFRVEKRGQQREESRPDSGQEAEATVT